MSSSSSIHSAAQNKQLSLVRALVAENPACVNAIDADTRAPLHWAASTGALDVARFLLDHGAQVDAPDGSGWTPLHIAVSAGHEDVVRELLGAGADVGRTNDKGLTPLHVLAKVVRKLGLRRRRHYAASKSRIDIGRFLIERGADINVRDKANQLPLHRAATTGSTGFVRLLLNPPQAARVQKPRLNTGDRLGNTPLHLALESAHAEVAVLLIEAGADRSRENLDSETAEQLQGVGGQEQRRALAYIVERCGPA